MELRDLEAFVAAARFGNFGQAAEARFMSHSGLSRAVGRVEDELGVPLFDRVGRIVRLNRYGGIFLARVEEAFQALDTGWAEITDAVDPNRGIVTLAFMPTIGPTLVPRLLRGFNADHQNVRFQLSQGGADAIIDMLRSGTVDLCLTAPDPGADDIDWLPLWREAMVLAVPAGHDLLQEPEVSLQSLNDVPLVTLRRGFGIRQILDEHFAAAGIRPRIVFEAADVPTVRGLVSAGLGASILPPAVNSDQEGMPVELELHGTTVERVVGIANVRGRYMPAAAQAFRDHVVRASALAPTPGSTALETTGQEISTPPSTRSRDRDSE